VTRLKPAGPPPTQTTSYISGLTVLLVAYVRGRRVEAVPESRLRRTESRSGLHACILRPLDVVSKMSEYLGERSRHVSKFSRGCAGVGVGDGEVSPSSYAAPPPPPPLI